MQFYAKLLPLLYCVPLTSINLWKIGLANDAKFLSTKKDISWEAKENHSINGNVHVSIFLLKIDARQKDYLTNTMIMSVFIINFNNTVTRFIKYLPDVLSTLFWNKTLHTCIFANLYSNQKAGLLKREKERETHILSFC